MVREEKHQRNLNHKLLLILIKYIPHLIAFIYMIYNALGIMGIDVIWIGYIAHVSLLPWCIFLFLSIIFRYCYVHRLPLYYIASSEIITLLDYFLDYSISESLILMIHFTLVIVVINIYTIYYVKNHKKRIKTVN